MKKNNKKDYLKKYNVINRKNKIIDYLIIIFIILCYFLYITRFKNIFGSDTDWVIQHTVYPDYFRELFYKTGNLLPNLSFHLGGGQNIFNFSYYGLLSPIVLLSFFLPFLSIVTYTQIISIIVMISTGILFYNFMERHGNSRFMCLFSSILIILSTPLLFHVQKHIMFVNYMPFLIMGFFGVDNYLEKKKKLLLIISVFLMIMTSYYFSVTGIIALCIYYLYEYLNKCDEISIKKLIIDIIKFGLIILVSVMLSGILLIPTVYTIFAGRNSGGAPVNFIKLLIPDLNFNELFNDSYSIGLSVYGLISLLYLFFSKKRNNIIIATIISIIILIPLFRVLLNGGLYARVKCFIPFVPLFCIFIVNMVKDIFDKKIDYKKFSIFILIISILAVFNNKYPRFYVGIIIFIISLFLYQKYNKRIIIVSVIILTLLSLDYYSISKEIHLPKKMYNEYNSKEVIDNINKINDIDKSYYRTSNNHYPVRTVNKIYNNHYYTASIFSSTYNGDYMNLFSNDFKQSNEVTSYFVILNKENILWNSYMGVKYVSSPYELGIGYENVFGDIYKNNYAFPIIYARSNIMSLDDYHQYSFPYNEEILLNNVIIDGESSNSYTKNHIDKKSIKYDVVSSKDVDIVNDQNGFYLIVKDNGELTIEIKDDIKNKLLLLSIRNQLENDCNDSPIYMKINNEANVLNCKESYYYNNNTTFNYLLDSNKKTLKIELLKGKYNLNDIDVYVLDQDKIFNNDYDEMNIIEMEDDRIIGDINVSNDGYLVTSIPYDDGFDIYIDNEKVEKEEVNLAFLGTKITKGKHNIKITYHSPWLNYGIILSGIGLISLMGIIIFDKKKKVK